MKITDSVFIIQPGYIPWVGFFSMMSMAETVIFLNDVQYDKNGWRNRNRIKQGDDILWLTVPVSGVGLSKLNNDEVFIAKNTNWQRKHLETLNNSYPNADPNLLSSICEVLKSDHFLLMDLNIKLIELIMKYLGINKKLYFSSDYGDLSGKNERIIQLCKAVGATSYISGPTARTYIDAQLFNTNKIALYWYDYNVDIEYRQSGQKFISYLSVIDLILNNSLEESLTFIKAQKNFTR